MNMSIDKKTFQDIFNFKEKTPQEIVLQSIVDNSQTPADVLFSASSIFQSGRYLAKSLKNKPNFNVEVVASNTNQAVFKILKTLEMYSQEEFKSLTLYPDEISAIEEMFDTVLKHYEYIERYEDCALLVKYRNYFLKNK
jgi:hypothetical protein